MDTSLEYILMCAKAIEIQGLRGPHLESPHEWFADENGHIASEDDGYYYGICYPEIWLPRQDQLQEMVAAPTPEYPKPEYMSSTWRLFMWAFCDPKNDGDLRAVTKSCSSMEQLWLSFVMHEKYKKKWDGTDWIAE